MENKTLASPLSRDCRMISIEITAVQGSYPRHAGSDISRACQKVIEVVRGGVKRITFKTRDHLLGVTPDTVAGPRVLDRVFLRTTRVPSACRTSIRRFTARAEWTVHSSSPAVVRAPNPVGPVASDSVIGAHDTFWSTPDFGALRPYPEQQVVKQLLRIRSRPKISSWFSCVNNRRYFNFAGAREHTVMWCFLNLNISVPLLHVMSTFRNSLTRTARKVHNHN
jgi:hypothetical protein